MSRSISSAFSYVVVAQIVVVIVGAVTTPLLTRILGPSTYGQYAVVLAFFNLFQVLMTSGITSGSKKFFSEDRELARWEDHVWGYYTRLAALFALGFAGVLIAIARLGLVEWLYGPDYILYFYVLAIMAFAVQYRDYTNRVLMGLHLESYSEPLKVIRKTSFGVLAVSLAYLGYGVVGVLIGHIVASIIIIVTTIIILWQKIALSTVFKRPPQEFPKKELRSFSYASVIYVFFLTSLYHVDVLMLRGYVEEASVGHYRAALVVVELLWVAPHALQSVMIQSVAPYWQNDKVGKINEIAINSTRYIFLFTLLCAIGLVALADVFVPLYFGSDYAPAVVPLLLLLPGTIGFAVTRPILTITQSKGNLRPLIIATGIAAGLNLLLNAVLIPFYGVIGAAIATSIGYGTLMITQYYCAKYVGYRPFETETLYQIGMTCLVAGPPILIAGYLLEGYLALIIVPPFGAIVFTLAAILTGAITSDEIHTATSRILPQKYAQRIIKWF